MITRTSTRLGLIAAAALLVLTGCSSTEAPGAGASASPSEDAATVHRVPAGVTLTDAWVKATTEGMSAVFGDIVNTGSEDVTLSAAGVSESRMVELHETVDNGSGQMVMRQKDGGFVIPAGGTFELRPGGNHIMLMDLTGPLVAGNTVTLTLAFMDGSVIEQAVPIKDFAGANETYESEAPTPGSGH
ncbi:copper chaperone PCu(A)C [Mycetocola tolaasinivorans]|uniref:Copper chaperone PCu(A)C n=1 Tax=Mycetocola tolaasinivorans TaxID=76635 RepID=A0A3L7A6C1_9MICO|nr:copper chaperone PCu(A)C [Mycetocola tolaasinivorans]RLP75707.1 copper chaperone PCu(A)C [Mycetocola tolaasinivorans]